MARVVLGNGPAGDARAVADEHLHGRRRFWGAGGEERAAEDGEAVGWEVDARLVEEDEAAEWVVVGGGGGGGNFIHEEVEALFGGSVGAVVYLVVP